MKTNEPQSLESAVPQTAGLTSTLIPESKPKRVLVVGGSGMLGTDVVQEFKANNWEVTAPNSKELNLRRKDHLEKLRKHEYGQFEWVVNCAAYTAVDKAEEEFFEAHALNGVAPGALAYVCDKNEWRFLHVSTDFVFDGTSQEPYTEEHLTAPLGNYGTTKLMGEKNVFDNCKSAVIARTAWLYGPNGKCFPKTMIKAWLDGKSLRVVNDQWGSPTYTADLARVMVDIIECDAPGGVYHTAGTNAMTWHDFAVMAIETYRDAVLWIEKEVKIEPVPTSAYPTPAKRPAYSVLSFDKASGLGIEPMRDTTAALLDFCLRLPKPLA